MSVTANEYLSGILGVLNEINITLSSKKESTSQDDNLKKMVNPTSDIKPHVEENKKKSNLNDYIQAISSLSKISVADITKTILFAKPLSLAVEHLIKTFDKINTASNPKTNNTIEMIKKLTTLVTELGKKDINTKAAIDNIKDIDKLIDDLNIIIKKIDKISTPTKQNDKIKKLTDFIISIKELIKESVILSLVSVVAIPLISIGFVGISIVLLGLWGLSKMINIFSKKISTVTKVKARGDIELLISYTKDIIKLIGSVILLSLISTVALPFIVLGIVSITLTLLGLLGVSKIINKMSKSLDAKSYTSIKEITIFSLMAAGIVFAAFGIYLLMTTIGGGVLQFMGGVMLGLLAISVTTIALVGLSKLVKRAENATKHSKKSFLILGSFILMSSAIILLSYLTGLFLGDGRWQTALLGFTAMGISLIALAGIAKLVGKIKIEPKSLLIMAGVIALLLLMTYTFKQMANLTKSVQEIAGGSNLVIGWLRILEGFGFMLAIVTAMGAFVMGIGYAIIPVGLFIAAGAVVIAGISGIMLLTTSAIDSLMKSTKNMAIEDVNKSLSIADTFLDTSKEIITKLGSSFGFTDIIKARMAIKTISGLMDSLSQFMDLISNFAAGNTQGTIKPIRGYDDKGNAMFGAEIDIVTVATLIGNSFSLFATTVLSALGKINLGMFIGRTVKTISTLIDPIGKFAEIMTKYQTNDDGKIRVIRVDKNGNIIKDKDEGWVDIKKVANGIGEAFVTFASTIMEKINTIKGLFRSQSAINVLTDMMTPITSFIDNLNKIGNPEDIKTKSVAISSILTNLSVGLTDISNVNLHNTVGMTPAEEAIETAVNISGMLIEMKGDKSMVDKASYLSSSLTYLTKPLKNLSQIKTSDDGINMIKDYAEIMNNIQFGITEYNKTVYMHNSINLINKSFDADNMNKFNKEIPKLTTNAVNYVDKLGNAMKKQRTEIEKYAAALDKISDVYDKLTEKRRGVNEIVLELKTGNTVENNINMDSKQFADIYKDAAPMIANEISRVLGDITLKIPANAGIKAGEITVVTS